MLKELRYSLIEFLSLPNLIFYLFLNAFDMYLNQLRDNTSEWKRKYS